MIRAFWFILPINLVLIATGIAREQLGLPVEWMVIEGSIVVVLNAVWLLGCWRSTERAASRN